LELSFKNYRQIILIVTAKAFFFAMTIEKDFFF